MNPILPNRYKKNPNYKKNLAIEDHEKLQTLQNIKFTRDT